MIFSNISKRNKIILLSILGLVLAILIVGGIYWYLNNKTTKVPLKESSDFVNVVPISGPPINSDEPLAVTEKPALQSSLKAVATTFTERFGSYSNESNFSNLSDLKILMTDKMKSWAIGFISQQLSVDQSIYYGIDTKAINAKVKSFDEKAGLADIQVVTQRQEFKGGLENPKTFYQNLNLKLVQLNGAWLVDQASWEDR
ncbi:MAG: hypothetical protein JW816_02885 [Candidatus Buchananbacteria bacterium]|nr:hypothetical protein [Candidatus Buchananbacteria bacterium]